MRIRTETVHRVDYSDFEAFVEETYGQPFSFPADVTSGNDTSHSLHANKRTLCEDEREEIDVFVATGQHGYLSHLLLDDLCSKGLVPEGSYVVDVCW